MAIADDSFSYNGHSFDRFAKTKVTSTPIWDDAKRFIKLLQILIEVRGYLAGGTDATMQNLRRVLEAPGKRLQYNSRGYGTLDVNPAGPVYDCDWGPKPGKLGYTAIGAPEAAVFEWSVTCCIPECDHSVYRNALMMACYSIDYDIDVEGLTTISVSGAIEIPLMLRNGNVLPDNADAYRERCFPPVPLGYQRGQKKFKLSDDRKRGTFSYVDREIPIPLPAGTTMCDVRHRIRNKTPLVFVNWDCSISGTVRMNPALPKITALERFLRIVVGRWQRAIPQQASLVGPPQQRSRILVDTYEFSEAMFGLESQFSVNYRLMRTNDISGAIRRSGLWQLPTDETFTTWRNSLEDNAHHPRGTRRAYYANGEDTFVDLCMPARNLPVRSRATIASATGAGSNTASQLAPGSGDTPTNREFIPRPVLAPMDRLLPIFGEKPDDEVSWLAYETNLVYDEDDNIAIHKPLAGKVTTTRPQVDPTDPKANFDSQTSVETLVQSTTPDITQRLSSPSVRVILYGYAERYGHQVAPPRLIRFDGKEATQLRATIEPNKLIGRMNGVPIYRTTWAILYHIASPPPVLPTLANPLLQI